MSDPRDLCVSAVCLKCGMEVRQRPHETVAQLCHRLRSAGWHLNTQPKALVLVGTCQHHNLEQSL
jgi:hypothetical protein